MNRPEIGPDSGIGIPSAPSRRQKRLVLVLLLLGVAGAVGIGVKVGKHALFPKRFAVVEDGLYRSGQCEPRPLRNIIRDRKLKTILTLLHYEPGSEAQDNEELLASKEGVRIIRIPMPGDGRGTFEALDRAAAVIADPTNRPLLVHCAAGVNRTGAAYAAWRMNYCGWDFEKALSEMEKYGYSEKDTPQLKEHLRAYYTQHVEASKDRKVAPIPGGATTQPKGETWRPEHPRRGRQLLQSPSILAAGTAS